MDSSKILDKMNESIPKIPKNPYAILAIFSNYFDSKSCKIVGEGITQAHLWHRHENEKWYFYVVNKIRGIKIFYLNFIVGRKERASIVRYCCGFNVNVGVLEAILW